MCGITFILDKKRQGLPREAILQANAALKHRGPDHSDYFAAENLLLGHTRLKIVDLEGGDQPFFNETRTVVLMCNGEIYNFPELRKRLADKGHHFRSRCDPEVIVHLYEEDPDGFDSTLDGTLAFVLLDLARGRVLVGRDKTGIKPFVLYEDDQWLIGSSEVKGVYSTGLAERALDVQAIYDSFTFGYIPGEASGFRKIRRLAPATLSTFDLEGRLLREQEYWKPEFRPGRALSSLWSSTWASKLRKELTSAVDSHRMGDVPVSSYLSGGIDSTIVTGLLREVLSQEVPLKTFSIGFDGGPYDESSVFQETTKLWKLESCVHRLTELDMNEYADAICMIEQPQFTPIDYPLFQLSRLIRNEGMKVALVGEGADELFGGYVSFTFAKIRRWSSVFKSARNRRMALGAFFSYMIADASNQRNFVNVYSRDAKEVRERFGTFPVWYPFWFIGDQGKDKLFLEDCAGSLRDGGPLQKSVDEIKNSYQNISEFDKSVYLELKTRLCNYILHRSDRNSMAHSVEVRVPFLSGGMLDLSFRIPAKWKLRMLQEKYILRRAFNDLIPDHVMRKQKQGFNAPNQLIWKSGGEALERYLGEDTLRAAGIFSVARVHELRETLQGNSLKGNQFLQERILNHLTGVITTQMLQERLIQAPIEKVDMSSPELQTESRSSTDTL